MQLRHHNRIWNLILAVSVIMSMMLSSFAGTVNAMDESAAAEVPQITAQPVRVTVSAGETATFTVAAAVYDEETLSYQWQQSADNGSSWDDISGATAESYTTEEVDTADNGNQYRCMIVNNINGTTASNISDAAILTVNAADTTADKEITAAADIKALEVPYGTALAELELPQTVAVTLADDSTSELSVNWDEGTPAYDKNTAGKYSFSGTLILPDEIINTDEHKASVEVTVLEQEVQPELTALTSLANAAGNWQDNIGKVSLTGSGTKDKPYQISSAEELAYLAQRVNEGYSNNNEAYYELTQDIDLAAHEWTPIGNGTNKFKGYFDGKGHEINNITIGTASNPDDNYKYVGLFGYVDEASTMANSTIVNIGVSVSIYSSKSDAKVGGLVGFIKGFIYNSYATGDVSGGDEASVGGLVGNNVGGTISNSYATGDVTGGKYTSVGGLVGSNAYGTISNSYATGDVTEEENASVGGLVGNNVGGTISNSYATGDVTGGKYTFVGGLVGRNAYCTISNGYYNTDAKQKVDDSQQESKGVGYGTDNTEGKTSEQMQSEDFVKLLNENLEDGWIRWEKDENTGYPTFSSTTITPPISKACFGGEGNTELFLHGKYIELGISNWGDFGTLGNKPKGFRGTRASGGSWYSSNRIGMSADHDGFNEGKDFPVDYYLPGTPEERFVVGYKKDGVAYTNTNSAQMGDKNMLSDTLNLSNIEEGKLKAKVVSTWEDKMEITQLISFNEEEAFYRNEVTIKNISGEAMDNVRYMRSFDPDNTVFRGGSFTTKNTILKTHEAGDGKAVVIAETIDGDPLTDIFNSKTPIFFYSKDPKARVSAFGFTNKDPYDYLAYDHARPKGYEETVDGAINITYDAGTLEAGKESDTFVYYTSLDNRTFYKVIKDIEKDEENTPKTPTDIGEGGPTHTVTFKDDGNTIGTVKVNDGLPVNLPVDPIKIGYSFLGWQVEGCGSLYNVTEDITAKAVYIPMKNPKTVTFVDNQCGSEVPPISVETGSTIEEPAVPTKEGYEFKGWVTEGDKLWLFASGTVDSKMTLYASWENLEDKVFFKDTEKINSITVPTGTESAAALSRFPEKINITDSQGETHEVIVTWNWKANGAVYNANEIGVYEAEGTFALPEDKNIKWKNGQPVKANAVAYVIDYKVSTGEATDVRELSAIVSGSVYHEGISSITERGIVYGTSLNPTIDDTKVIAEGTSTGEFTVNLTGLIPGITYHARAYAVTGEGTVYGNDIDFKTISNVLSVLPDEFTAIEGVHTNFLDYLYSIEGVSESGVTLSLGAIENANIAGNGDISYTDKQVVGNVEVKINKVPGTERTKTVAVTVLAHTSSVDDLKEDLDNLEIGYAPGDDAQHVTRNLYLPRRGQSGHSSVTWESSAAAVTAAGRVTRPTGDDLTVTLTATLTHDISGAQKTKIFTVKVLKKTDKDCLEEAARNLNIRFAPGDTWECVTSELTLLDAGLYGTTINWTSNKPDFIQIKKENGKTAGSINRPEEADVNVILTAKISLGGNSITKTFLLVVKNQAVTKDDSDVRQSTSRQADLKVGQNGTGNQDNVEILRTELNNGTKIDTVIVDQAKMENLTDNINPDDPDAGKRTVTVQITQAAADPADELAVELPAASLAAVAAKNAGLDIKTDEGSVSIEEQELQDVVQTGTDLYFRIVPVKEQAEQEEAEHNLSTNMTVVEAADGAPINALSIPRKIETNFSGQNARVALPLSGIEIPDNDREAFLDSMRIFIEHSDGSTELLRGTLQYVNGQPTEIGFIISKFSRFQILNFYEASSGGSHHSHHSSSSDKGDYVTVYVNGEGEKAGILTTAKEEGQSIHKITVDAQNLEPKLKEEGKNAIVTVPFSNTADKAIAVLSGQQVKDMAGQQVVIKVKTENETYTLPAVQIDMESIADKLGKNIALEDIDVKISIAEPGEDMVKTVEKAAQSNDFTITVPAVNFTVQCSSDDENVKITNYSVYVQRSIAIPEDTNQRKITTAVVVEPDGSVRHVPTKVTKADGIYYAEINSLTDSTYVLVYHPLEFKDATGHWAEADINDMGSRMVVNGVGHEQFEPDRDITRAEFAAIVVRALGLKPGTGSNPFADVAQDTWYCDYIKTAHAYGIINGYEDNIFKPLNSITREEAMTMAARAMAITGLKEKAVGQELAGYIDLAQVGAWAKDSIAGCVSQGIVTGKTADMLAPKDNITRAEVAAIISRLLQQSDLI